MRKKTKHNKMCKSRKCGVTFWFQQKSEMIFILDYFYKSKISPGPLSLAILSSQRGATVGEMSSDLHLLCSCNGSEPEKQERLLTDCELNMTLPWDWLISHHALTLTAKHLMFVWSFYVRTRLCPLHDWQLFVPLQRSQEKLTSNI